MSHFSAAARSDVTTDTPTTALFKPDRPRHIDHFIDYFGGTDQVPADDPRGEDFLADAEDSDE